MTPVEAILWIPALAIPVLALTPNYRLGAMLNVLASGLTFAAGVSLLFAEPCAATSC
jgi:hydrogenase-4 component F